MKIDRKLNIVIPVERGDGVAYVHATPISREVFERYFLVISKAFAAIYNEGLGIMAGPAVAGLILKKVADDMGVWDGPGGVQMGLVAEIRRLSNVICPGPNGWAMVPMQEAVDRNYFDADDVAEVENALAYFTVASSMHKKASLKAFLDGASELWGGQITSSSCTDFLNSLPTSTETASTGVKATASSLPS